MAAEHAADIVDLLSENGNERVRLSDNCVSVALGKENNVFVIWRRGIYKQQADGTLTLTFQLRKGRLTCDHTESITPDWEAGRFRHNHGGWSEE